MPHLDAVFRAAFALCRREPDAEDLAQTTFAKCSMVSVELDGYTYCAVGEAPRDYLTDLLEQLVR